jgi:hypothetical protein
VDISEYTHFTELPADEVGDFEKFHRRDRRERRGVSEKERKRRIETEMEHSTDEKENHSRWFQMDGGEYNEEKRIIKRIQSIFGGKDAPSV